MASTRQERVDPPTAGGALNPTPPARTRRWVLPVVLVVVVLVVILGLRWWTYNRAHVSTDDAQVYADITAVSARIPGYIASVKADRNDSVSAGQLLAEIDPRDYRVALDQAQAAYEQAAGAAQAASGTVNVTQQTGGAGITQAEAGVAEAQAAGAAAQRQVGTAQAAVVGARAQADEATRDAARTQTLFSQGAVSRQQADQTQAAAVTARANLAAAQAQLSSAQATVAQARARQNQAVAAVRSSQASPAQVGVTRAQAKSAQANVAAAKAKVEQARLNLAYTRIIAPVDGVVAQKDVEVGQYVQPGSPLFALVPRVPVYVEANFKETQLEKIRPRQRATFTVDAYPGVTFTGRVESLNAGTGSVFSLLPPENATGNFTKVVQRVPVRIRIDPRSAEERPLRAGMNVVATVDVGR